MKPPDVTSAAHLHAELREIAPSGRPMAHERLRRGQDGAVQKWAVVNAAGRAAGGGDRRRRPRGKLGQRAELGPGRARYGKRQGSCGVINERAQRGSGCRWHDLAEGRPVASITTGCPLFLMALSRMCGDAAYTYATHLSVRRRVLLSPRLGSARSAAGAEATRRMTQLR